MSDTLKIPATIAGFFLKDGVISVYANQSARILWIKREPNESVKLALPILQAIASRGPVEIEFRISDAEIVTSRLLDAQAMEEMPSAPESSMSIVGCVETVLPKGRNFEVQFADTTSKTSVPMFGLHTPRLLSSVIASWASDTPITLSIQENGEIIDAQPAG